LEPENKGSWNGTFSWTLYVRRMKLRKKMRTKRQLHTKWEKSKRHSRLWPWEQKLFLTHFLLDDAFIVCLCRKWYRLQKGNKKLIIRFICLIHFLWSIDFVSINWANSGLFRLKTTSFVKVRCHIQFFLHTLNPFFYFPTHNWLSITWSIKDDDQVLTYFFPHCVAF